ncbi:MAG: hypothetical protein MJZ61_06655 [Bacteroidales bacterium]|nr:hypothetical protein [Bacteroidales bacterium]
MTIILPALSSAQITIISNLENQNIGMYRYNAESNTLTFSPGKDSLNTVAVWFNFGVSGYRMDTALTIVETAEKYVHRTNFPAISYNNHDFSRIRAQRIEDGVSATFWPERDTVYLATGFPYTYSRMDSVVKQCALNRNCEVSTLATTANGLKVSELTFEWSKGKHPKKLVWIICRQHAFESTGSFVMEGMLNYLLSDNCSKQIRKRYIFKIVPMVDVESVYKGQTGRMARPRDYNRDWENPIHESIKLLEKEISESAQKYKYHIFWDIHGTFPGGLVNYNFSYFDLYDSSNPNIGEYWKEFKKLSGFAPRHINDDSYDYEGMPADTWNKKNFPELYFSSTLEMDWNLDYHNHPWTEESMMEIGRNMIRAMK